MVERVALYVRESVGSEPSMAEQEAALRGFCAARGWAVASVHREPARPREGRRVRQAMFRDAGARFGRVVTAALCRIATSLPGLISVLAALRERGVAATVAGGTAPDTASVEDATIAVPTVALEQARRAWTREKVAAGKARARARGVRFGRPRVPDAKMAKVRAALAEGQGIRPTARAAGVGVATVARIRDGMAPCG